MVAKPKTVVTFGLVLRLRVSKVSTVTGIGGFVVAKPRAVVTFGLVLRLRVSKVSTVTGIGGVVVAKPRAVVTFGPGIGRVVVAKLRTVVTFKSVNSHRDRGGRGEAQDCRHFWTRLVSSHLKSVNSHRDRGVVVAKPRAVVTVGLVSSLRVSKVSAVIGIGRVVVAQRRTVVTLDSSCVFAPQQCQQSQGSGGRGRETQSCRHFWTRLSREERREEREEKREMRGERREERGEEESG